jgi:hypothetical protein
MNLPATFTMQLDERTDRAQLTDPSDQPFLRGKYRASGQFAMFYDAALTRPCLATQPEKPAYAVYDSATNTQLGRVQLLGRSWRLASTWKVFDANNATMFTLQQDVGLGEFWMRFFINATPRHYRLVGSAQQPLGQAKQIWVKPHLPTLRFECPDTLRNVGDLRLIYAAALLVGRYDVETVQTV